MKSFQLHRPAKATGCPRCGDAGPVAGRLLGQLDAGLGFVFRPSRRRMIGGDVAIDPAFFACVACGHLWSSVSPDRLRRAVRPA